MAKPRLTRIVPARLLFLRMSLYRANLLDCPCAARCASNTAPHVDHPAFVLGNSEEPATFPMRFCRSIAPWMLWAFLGVGVVNARSPEPPKKPKNTPVADSAAADHPDKGTAAHSAATSAQRAPTDYVIGPSDVLAVDVWKDAQITRTVPVRPDGKISLPLIGEMEVNGLTAINVQDLVTKRLRPYITDPQVTVIVEQVKSRAYSVLGKVSKPGSYVLDKPTTVLEAIAKAAGFADFAKLSKIYVMRSEDGKSATTLHFDYKKVIKGQAVNQNVQLRSGDTIVVP